MKKTTKIAAGIFVAMIAVILIAHSMGVVFTSTFWALVPPLVAIILALLTKEAY